MASATYSKNKVPRNILQSKIDSIVYSYHVSSSNCGDRNQSFGPIVRNKSTKNHLDKVQHFLRSMAPVNCNCDEIHVFNVTVECDANSNIKVTAT